jgi:hypothetical protein
MTISTFVLLALVTPLQASPPQTPGVAKLTPTTFAAAVAEGEQLGDETKAHEAASLAITRMGAEMSDKAPPMNAESFEATVITPYYRVVVATAQAKRKFAAQPSITLEAANKDLVEIVVTPGRKIREADAIESVVVKRGAEVIRPIRQNVTPVTVETAMGLKKTLTEGRFVFGVETFDPSAAPGVTIVLVGKNGNVEWPFTATELRRWK